VSGQVTPASSGALDRAQVRRAFDRASNAYEAAAVLQARVRQELLERLNLVGLAPQAVLDLGCGTGSASRELKRRYRHARVLALDFAPGMLRAARRHLSLWRRFDRVCADALRLPLRTGSIGLVFSNLMLQWCDDLDAALAEARRVLAPGGFLTFSTFGPDTLRELRSAWSAVDAASHVSEFLDMHDIGAALARARFSEPVLDVDRIELTYADTLALAHDLRAIGAQNARAARNRGLTGRSRWRAMTQAYEPFRRDGRLPATYEIIYGAAWAPPQSDTVPAATEARIPVSAIRRRRA
jgi:malonyl-CoA O-methyltransferase